MSITGEQAIERLKHAEQLLSQSRELIENFERYRPLRKENMLRDIQAYEENKVCYDCGKKPEKMMDINGLSYLWCNSCNKKPFE
jgi:hypothetical protein